MDHQGKLQYIEQVTMEAHEVQRAVLREILAQNAGAEYLGRIGVAGEAPDAEHMFRLRAPLTTYEHIFPDVVRIANGDTSAILSGKPITEFLTSSGTSGGQSKMMPTISEDMDRRVLLYGLLTPVMSQALPGLDKGKVMNLYFVRAEKMTPGGLPARPVLTSYYRSPQFLERQEDPFNKNTSPDEAVLCLDTKQSLYAQLLCGLLQRMEVLRAGAIFASGFLRAINFLEKNWPRLCEDIRAGTLNGGEITDPAVRAAVERVLRPDPALADALAAEFSKPSWSGIVTRVWPNMKCIEVIVTGAMAQYVPILKDYGGGVHLCSTMYASSESYFGLNLDPTCDPAEVVYTLIPSLCYFELLPVGSDDARDLVQLVDVKLGQEYELVVTTYAGLYRYRVGDVLRVAGFKNKAPKFFFVRRMNVVLSVDVDKTDEAELHAAVSGAAARHLPPFGATLMEYTSYGSATGAQPGHYVLYWELRGTAPAAAFQECCKDVEGALSSVYAQLRKDGVLGPLEIRHVTNGTFAALMDDALSKGASMNQYKSPRCISSDRHVQLLEARVIGRYI